jgi:hypothetical protein
LPSRASTPARSRTRPRWVEESMVASDLPLDNPADRVPRQEDRRRGCSISDCMTLAGVTSRQCCLRRECSIPEVLPV